MDVLYYLSGAETLRKDKRIKVLYAPPGIYDIEINDFLTKDYYIGKGFDEVEVEIVTVRPK